MAAVMSKRAAYVIADTLHLARELERSQSVCSNLIDRTPTSDQRNHLTDANMHLMLAIESLNKAAR